MRRWVIADNHWFHDRILSLCNRPANHMDLLISNCQRLIKPDDVLYDLGDVIFYHYERLAELLAMIPCRKILVRGNHDKKRDGWYVKQGFSEVCNAIFVGGCLLTHRPLDEIPGWAQYNIFGHVHNSPWQQTDRRQIRLSLELEHYQPVQLETLIQRAQNNDFKKAG